MSMPDITPEPPQGETRHFASSAERQKTAQHSAARTRRPLTLPTTRWNQLSVRLVRFVSGHSQALCAAVFMQP